MHEKPADEVIGGSEDGELTLGEFADQLNARRELQDEAPSDHVAALLHDIRAALKIPGLSSEEKRFLHLRYEFGLDRKEVAKRMRRSLPHLGRLNRSVVGKLRVHFASRGALPQNAPIPPDGNHTHTPRRSA